MEMDLHSYIRNIEDFPKKGVIFRDITPLLLSPEATSEALARLCAQAEGLGVTKVAAVESRGFFFGSLSPIGWAWGMCLWQEEGKLPYDMNAMTYDLEYGTVSLEIHTDAIAKGDKVLVHDDVLATGGTAEAVVKLIEKAGGEVVLFSFLMELKALGGTNKLKGYNVKCLMEF